MVLFLDSQEDQKLGGPGYVFEIDESSFKKKSKYGRGKKHKDRWVFGIVQRDPTKSGTGKQRYFAVPNRNRQTLLSIILKHVAPGSKIISDAWGAYHTLGDHGYKHHMVNHSAGFVDQDCPEVCYIWHKPRGFPSLERFF